MSKKVTKKTTKKAVKKTTKKAVKKTVKKTTKAAKPKKAAKSACATGKCGRLKPADVKVTGECKPCKKKRCTQ